MAYMASWGATYFFCNGWTSCTATALSWSSVLGCCTDNDALCAHLLWGCCFPCRVPVGLVCCTFGCILDAVRCCWYGCWLDICQPLRRACCGCDPARVYPERGFAYGPTDYRSDSKYAPFEVTRMRSVRHACYILCCSYYTHDYHRGESLSRRCRCCDPRDRDACCPEADVVGPPRAVSAPANPAHQAAAAPRAAPSAVPPAPAAVRAPPAPVSGHPGTALESRVAQLGAGPQSSLRAPAITSSGPAASAPGAAGSEALPGQADVLTPAPPRNGPAPPAAVSATRD